MTLSNEEFARRFKQQYITKAVCKNTSLRLLGTQRKKQTNSGHPPAIELTQTNAKSNHTVYCADAAANRS